MLLGIEKKNKSLLKISSHRSFLNHCKNIGMVANGLTTNLQISAAQTDEELTRKIEFLPVKNSIKALDIIVDHYETVMKRIELDIIKLKEQLNTCCQDQLRFEYLSQCLNSFKQKDLKGFNKIKKKKISKLTPNRDMNSFQSQDKDVGLSAQWIRSLNLTKQEKPYLTSGEEICDRLID